MIEISTAAEQRQRIQEDLATHCFAVIPLAAPSGMIGQWATDPTVVLARSRVKNLQGWTAENFKGGRLVTRINEDDDGLRYLGVYVEATG